MDGIYKLMGATHAALTRKAHRTALHGQGTTEYVILVVAVLTVIVVIIAAFNGELGKLGKALTDKFAEVVSSITKPPSIA